MCPLNQATPFNGHNRTIFWSCAVFNGHNLLSFTVCTPDKWSIHGTQGVYFYLVSAEVFVLSQFALSPHGTHPADDWMFRFFNPGSPQYPGATDRFLARGYELAIKRFTLGLLFSTAQRAPSREDQCPPAEPLFAQLQSGSRRCSGFESA